MDLTIEIDRGGPLGRHAIKPKFAPSDFREILAIIRIQSNLSHYEIEGI